MNDEFFLEFKFALYIEKFICARKETCNKRRVDFTQLYEAFSPCTELFIKILCSVNFVCFRKKYM